MTIIKLKNINGKNGWIETNVSIPSRGCQSRPGRRVPGAPPSLSSPGQHSASLTWSPPGRICQS